ncbi:MAG TPA: sulfatase-like hydrolase/transferase [Kofleriaceae bacterium]|nr:sulfatase-like hydrolase/transferase [Kofleriaceae bacterium]
MRSLRQRLGAALRWLAPSAAAGCAGALIAGLVDGRTAAGPIGLVATAGFVALIGVPGLVVAAAIVRGLVAAWQPGALADRLTDPDGAAPRLAGWVAVIWLGALALAAAMFQSVWLLAAHTAFKPLVTSFLEPAFAVAVTLGIVALSRPCARLFAWLAGRIDARWRRTGRRTLLRPRIIVGAPFVAAAAVVYVRWRALIKPQIGPFDVTPIYAPLAGLAAAVALHAAWPRLGRARKPTGAVLAVATLAVLAVAAAIPFTRPSLTLEIWGDQPVAGLAIEAVFDLEAIRTRISMVEFRPEPAPGAPHPDIVLVTIDTVRADHTPPYGGAADMPALRELAARGTVFDWAFSPSNVTRRSVPSIVIGLAPNHVRGRVVGWALRVDPRHVLLAERLRAGGYDTAGFMCCQGFWGKEFHTGLERGLDHLEIDARGPALAHAANTWLTARDQRPDRPPLFVWMHIIEPHNWTQGNLGARNDIDHRLYDRALTASDQMLQQVLAAFAHRAPDRMPIVIVTADHGEALGEHGQPFHSTDLYNSQIRVPFVIAGPGIKPQHIAETVSVTDLVPTVLELAGFVAPRGPSVDGRSLADVATGSHADDPDGGFAFAAMVKDRSNPGGITAIVKGRWKLIDNHDTFELYDTRADPDERANVIAQHPQEVSVLRKLLDERTADGRSPFH